MRISGTGSSRSTDFVSRSLRELVGQGDQHTDFAFAYGALEGPRAFVSTVKLRQAGFAKTIDTEDAFRKALQFLLDHKLLPPPRNNPGRDTPFARTTFASPKHDAPTRGQP
jgi:hypothetical protein